LASGESLKKNDNFRLDFLIRSNFFCSRLPTLGAFTFRNFLLDDRLESSFFDFGEVGKLFDALAAGFDCGRFKT
jgi:hypothetical protein